GDPAGYGDVLLETDQARAVELRLDIAYGGAVVVGLRADAERTACELHGIEARAAGEDAGATCGDAVLRRDRRGAPGKDHGGKDHGDSDQGERRQSRGDETLCHVNYSSSSRLLGSDLDVAAAKRVAFEGVTAKRQRRERHRWQRGGAAAEG